MEAFKFVRKPTGKAIHPRGSGHSVNRLTLKFEIFCAHPLPKSPLLIFHFLSHFPGDFVHGQFPILYTATFISQLQELGLSSTSKNRKRWRQTGSRQSPPIDDRSPIGKFGIDRICHMPPNERENSASTD